MGTGFVRLDLLGVFFFDFEEEDFVLTFFVFWVGGEGVVGVGKVNRHV